MNSRLRFASGFKPIKKLLVSRLFLWAIPAMVLALTTAGAGATTIISIDDRNDPVHVNVTSFSSNGSVVLLHQDFPDNGSFIVNIPGNFCDPTINGGSSICPELEVTANIYNSGGILSDTVRWFRTGFTNGFTGVFVEWNSDESGVPLVPYSNAVFNLQESGAFQFVGGAEENGGGILTGNFVLVYFASDVATVPEPDGLALFGLGIIGLAWSRARRR